MLEGNIKKLERKQSGSPTQKQLEYVKKLAKQLDVQLNEDELASFDQVSRLIDELQKKIKPTDKQISFAKNLRKK